MPLNNHDNAHRFPKRRTKYRLYCWCLRSSCQIIYRRHIFCYTTISYDTSRCIYRHVAPSYIPPTEPATRVASPRMIIQSVFQKSINLLKSTTKTHKVMKKVKAHALYLFRYLPDIITFYFEYHIWGFRSMGWSFKSGKFRICVWNARLSCELSRYMFFQSLALSNDTHKTLFYSDIFVTFRYMRRCWCFEPWVSVKMKGYKTLPATMYFPLFFALSLSFSRLPL